MEGFICFVVCGFPPFDTFGYQKRRVKENSLKNIHCFIESLDYYIKSKDNFLQMLSIYDQFTVLS